jgi:phospholipid/cholesterol/gamma-HCH transport system ATP-binding protein
MEKEPLIEFQKVTKRFDTRTILDQVDLKIYEGEVTTIIGLSGTGKSVTLKHIIGLLLPDEGQILYRGKPLEQMTKAEWNEYIGQISYMFQNNALFDSMTVFENVALPLRQKTGLNKKAIEEKAMARIEQTELTEVAHKYPSEISGGMQKRAALARALVTDPQIVLFDEPTTGQDPVRKNAILGMVAQYQKKFGFTAILISHEIPDVFFISNRILALYDKKIVFEGLPEEFETLDHPFLDELVGSLEGLQQELTGLYSRRHFKVRYQTDFARRNQNDTYVAAVFKLENMSTISERLGHDTAQQIMRAIGSYIYKHFGKVGAFSSRQTIDEFGTVLPFSSMEEAERILADFVDDFKAQGMQELECAIERPLTAEDFYELTVSAGLAEGKPQVEVESIMEFARYKKEPIAHFKCSFGGIIK